MSLESPAFPFVPHPENPVKKKEVGEKRWLKPYHGKGPDNPKPPPQKKQQQNCVLFYFSTT